MPTLTFTNGNDTFVVNAAGTYDLTFLAGNDSLTLQHAAATTVADMGDGADVVSHKAGTADVDGGLGADRFEVYTSGLTADGGGDNDLLNIRGGTGLNLGGGFGDDRFNFYAASASIVLHGGDGTDDFFGYNQSISGDIFGDSGNDYFVQFRSGVILHGGTGNDIYRADASNPASFVELASQGTDSIQVARGNSFILPPNIENISVQGFSGSTAGSASLVGNDLANVINAHANAEIISGMGGNDRIAGKGGEDQLNGGDGNDYLDGGDGNDNVNGGAGNDIINGRAGSDTMAGGIGDDSYYVDSLSDLIIEGAGEGTDLARVSVNSFTLPANVENGYVTGSAGLQLSGNGLDNLLIGGLGNDSLRGGLGNDTLKGGAGNDFLEGDDFLSTNAGNDRLYGGAGDDTLQGENGDDILVGGLDQDYMSTGNGSDIVVYQQVGDALFDIFGTTDELPDFDVAFDRISFVAIDADVTLDGIQAFHFTGDSWDGMIGAIWLEEIEPFLYYLFAEINGDDLPDMAVLIELPGSASSFTVDNLIL